MRLKVTGVISGSNLGLFRISPIWEYFTHIEALHFYVDCLQISMLQTKTLGLLSDTRSPPSPSLPLPSIQAFFFYRGEAHDLGLYTSQKRAEEEHDVVAYYIHGE